MDKDFLREIKSLQNEIIRKNFKEKEHINFQMSPVQMQVIKYLLRNKDNDIHQKDLESELNVRKSTLSGIINTMEKNNIIQRVSSDKDSRSKKIVFTDEAMLKQEKIKKNFKRLNKILIKDIPQAKLNIFLEVINLMKNNIINDSEVKNDKNI